MTTLAVHPDPAPAATLAQCAKACDQCPHGIRTTSAPLDDDAKLRREAWTRACERYTRLAHANAFFAPLCAAVQALADGPCADVAIARVDGVDLHLARAHPAPAITAGDAVNVQLRALTGGALELRCLGRVPRTRVRVRIVAADHAAAAVEECLHELGWVTEGEWKEWQ